MKAAAVVPIRREGASTLTSKRHMPTDRLNLSGSVDIAQVTSEAIFFDHADLVHASFEERRFAYWGAWESRFEAVNWNKCAFTAANFGEGRSITYYLHCIFDNCDLARTELGVSRFERCEFIDCNLSGCSFITSDLVNCRFVGELRRVTIYGSDDVGGRRNVISGNDFSAARLIDVAFRRGVEIDNQSLPIGDEYLLLRDAAAALSRLDRQKHRFEGPAREGADLLLAAYSRDARQQCDLLLSKGTIGDAVSMLGATGQPIQVDIEQAWQYLRALAMN